MTICEILLNLFFAALSAFLGVVIGVWYSKGELAKVRATEKQELRRKLIKAFLFNVERLKQMHAQLVSPPQEIPDYRLDTESVAHVLFHGRDLFDDEAWFDRFNWQRFQLVHINAKVDFLNEITNLSDISSGSIFERGELGQRRFASLVNHLRVTQKEILQMISDYEKVA